MHRFTISTCETVSQMTKFNERKGYKGIKTIKIFEFENTRSYIKKCYGY